MLRICLQFRPHQGYDSARVRPLVALPSSAALVNPTVWVFFLCPVFTSAPRSRFVGGPRESHCVGFLVCAQCLRPLAALASSVALVTPTL